MKHLLVTATLVAAVLAARGELYSFTSITANDPSGFAPSAGESQLILDVSSTEEGQVSLVFSNSGPAQSAISQIYFDFDPDLKLELATIINGEGVAFKPVQGKGETLPAGKDLDMAFLSDFSVVAKNPKPVEGINPYESLELVLNYDDAYDLLDALANETLRIGLHVQAFTGGYSESFVNKPTHQEVIPEPGTLSILLTGAFILRWFRKR